tara:strand:- start:8737 stop:9915 length:1179 start_codon:yes stop_codon:yes gene_type:complete
MPHILETYALNCGVKINKPFIYEQYYPVGVEKYITLHSSSESQSKQYDYWDEVVDYIKSPLSKEGIGIVQIGEASDRGIRNCTWTQGTASFNQTPFILKNSMLHVGVNNYESSIASHYGVKMVVLCPNQYAASSGPYWSNEENAKVFESVSEDRKPSFSVVENPKTINEIYPEKIAQSILDLLGIDYKIPYQTVFIGDNYSSMNIQTVPSSPAQTSSEVTLIVRMDLEFNEQVLAHQASLGKCGIVTEKPIDTDLLSYIKPNIENLIYILDENEDLNFVKFLHENGIKHALMTDMEGEKLDKMKLKYLDYGFIFQRRTSDKDMDKIKEVPMDFLHFKTRKKIFQDGNVYNSVFDLKRDKKASDINDFSFSKVEDADDFWESLEDYYIVKKFD